MITNILNPSHTQTSPDKKNFTLSYSRDGWYNVVYVSEEGKWISKD